MNGLERVSVQGTSPTLRGTCKVLGLMAEFVASLRVLTCPTCGAAVALSRHPKTECSHCGAEVVIPEEHRLALRLVEEQVAAEAATQHAFRVLGRPPGLLLRLFAGVDLIAIPFLCCGFAYAIGWLEAKGWAWVELHQRVNVFDWLTPQELWMARWGALGLLCLAGQTLGALGRRRVVRLGALKAALQATVPKQAGGPALCRECGAPLSVPDDAWGVRCAYCRTDNLVTISPAWLTGGRHRVKAIAREASVALKQQRALTFALRGDLLLNVGGVLLMTALLEGYCFREGTLHPPREDRDLRAAWSGTRRMIGREYEGMGQPTPTPSSVPLSGCAERRRLPAADYVCGGGTCWVGWFVALRQSETLLVAPRARGTMRLYKHVGRNPWALQYGGLSFWGEKVGEVAVAPESPGRIVAPIAAWYRVNLVLNLDAPESGLTVCAGVE